MSARAWAWALEADLMAVRLGSQVRNCPSVAVLRCVLLGLADQADDSGHGACPSVGTLADIAGVDRRTAQRALRALADHGLIVGSAEPHPVYRTTVWRLQVGGSGLAKVRNLRAAL